MNADSIDIGKLNTWISAPSVYTLLPASEFDGLEITHKGALKDAKYNVQAFYGESESEMPMMMPMMSSTLNLDNTIGANVSVDYKGFTFRAGYGVSDVSFDLDHYTVMTLNDAMMGMMVTDYQEKGELDILSLGFSGKLTERISVMSEFVSVDADHPMETDKQGFYVTTNYECDHATFSATIGQSQKDMMNSTDKTTTNEFMLSATKEVYHGWLAKVEYANTDADMGGMKAESISMSMNYAF
jgi:hypothetical protein